jgi:hypothetical protein
VYWCWAKDLVGGREKSEARSGGWGHHKSSKVPKNAVLCSHVPFHLQENDSPLNRCPTSLLRMLEEILAGNPESSIAPSEMFTPVLQVSTPAHLLLTNI